MRVLTAAAQVTDAARSFTKQFQKEIEQALSFALRNGTVNVIFSAASEGLLRAKLADGHWDVLHLIAQTRSVPAANYATVDLESPSGLTRSVDAHHLCRIVAGGNVRVIVLYSFDQTSLEMLASELAEKCDSEIITANSLQPRDLRIFLAKLHANLASGELTGEFRIDLPGIRDWSRRMAQPSHSHEEIQPPVTGETEVDSAWQEIIDGKRKLGQFDVFLCHNSLDKPAVRSIARQLERARILPWLDERELPPGMPWIPLLESQIANIRSAAVFFGSAGVGPWQDEELSGFLRQFAKRRLPIIPVLLPDAPLEPELPIFLSSRTWVDFRSREGQPFARLIWAITGTAPSDLDD